MQKSNPDPEIFFDKNRSLVLKHAVGLRIFARGHYTRVVQVNYPMWNCRQHKRFCASVPECVAKLDYLIRNFMNFRQIARLLLKRYMTYFFDWQVSESFPQ